MKPLVVLFLLFFTSCCLTAESPEVDLRVVYNSLPSIQYSSQGYSVNNQFLVEKMIISPPSARTGERNPLNLKYKERELTTVYHTSNNSSVIIFAADTEIGNICSIYESQGCKNQFFFINGKRVDFNPCCAVTGFKIKENYFILDLSDGSNHKYIIYKP